jgi:hypothetical protein
VEAPCRAFPGYEADLRRGGRRTRAASAGPHGNRKLDVTGCVLILRLRDHLHLTVTAAGALFGIDPATVSHATTLTRKLIEQNAIPLPPAASPPPGRIRALAGLRGYAAQHGIDLTGLLPGTGTPPDATVTTPDTP